MMHRGHHADHSHGGHHSQHGHHSHHGHHSSHGQQIMTAYPAAYGPVQTYGAVKSPYSVQEEVHKHKQREHIAAVGVVGASAFAMYESHQVKKDPANAERHHKEEKLAKAAAVGLTGYALHERHEAHKLEKAEKHNKKHHRHHAK